MDTHALAELLFPHINQTPQDYEAAYPQRGLGPDAVVTRFAPSPTGFMHIGGLFAALVGERTAHQSGGVFYLRIEDTDKKREVEGGVAQIIEALRGFGIAFDEGAEAGGSYGPYLQSQRVPIYQACAKMLVQKGLAYPCFCSEEELGDTRKAQEEQKLVPGYYGAFAVCRALDLQDVRERLSQGKSYVLRLRAGGDPDKKFVYQDLIKGAVDVCENGQDIVLLKSDGVPTYHFAHAVDDHFMRTTHVIRGDEWLASLNVHLQLFEALGFAAPRYAHIAPIMKLEGASKRKLSKRKDPEAAVQYYHEQGYPPQAVMEYLLTLINSNFEDWRRDNPGAELEAFKVELGRMSVSGALFDMVKLADISKNVIAQMSAEAVADAALQWAKQYDTPLYRLMADDVAYATAIFAIGRGAQKPRKDIGKWSDIRDYVGFFYEELYTNDYPFPPQLAREDLFAILTRYKAVYNPEDDNAAWFDAVKALAGELGFSPDIKAYKKNPEAFKGHVGDVSMALRVAVTGRQNTPDLHDVMQTLGTDAVMKRLDFALEALL